MTVKILKPGLLSTIQDLGRFGSQKYGVIVGGAMDSLSVRIANILVGNEEGEATIEITMFGTELEMLEETILAITGGNLNPVIDGKNVPMWRPILIQKGQVLKFTAPSSGSRAYISLSGGIEVPEVMGSKSTHAHAKIGGHKGRELQKGDILSCGEITERGEIFMKQLKEENVPFEWFADYSAFYISPEPNKIRILKGSEFDYFDEASQKIFFKHPYKLTINANRMGYQLEGSKLALTKQFELLSEGVTYGTVQVPSNGQPIILMAERQTTGGYPKIGQVATVDLPRLAQLQPRDEIEFEMITINEAEKLLMKQEENIEALKVGIRLKQKLQK